MVAALAADAAGAGASTPPFTVFAKAGPARTSGTATLEHVRVAHHRGFDRVVFEFAGETPLQLGEIRTKLVHAPECVCHIRERGRWIRGKPRKPPLLLVELPAQDERARLALLEQLPQLRLGHRPAVEDLAKPFLQGGVEGFGHHFGLEYRRPSFAIAAWRRSLPRVERGDRMRSGKSVAAIAWHPSEALVGCAK